MDINKIKSLKIKPKLLSRSRYILFLRTISHRIGVKYVKELVFERSLESEINCTDSIIKIDVRVISIKDVDNREYSNVRFILGDNYQHILTKKRIAKGNKCLVAIIDNDVAGYIWLYFQKCKYEPAIEQKEFFLKDDALMYELNVLPIFRMKGVASKLIETGLSYLKDNKYKRVKVYIREDNIPSINTFRSNGFELFQKIVYIKMFVPIKRVNNYVKGAKK